MKVSVFIPTYSSDLYEDHIEAIEAARSQTYDDVEVVTIVDGNSEVCEKIHEKYGDEDDVIIYCVHENAGPVSRANMGAVKANGDILAITDGDAVAEKDWIEELVGSYERHDAVAVGGKMGAEWVAGKPEFLPEEFYFLIGVTHKGFQEEEKEEEVRNTFGGNLSFKREAFLKLGGIKLGGIAPSQIQGRETEFCARMRKEYGKGVIYNPDAVVNHKIYKYRTSKKWLIKRAFWQGVSKRGMEKWISLPEVEDEGTKEESKFLKKLMFRYIPERLKKTIFGRSSKEAKQLFMLLILTFMVGLGYLYGILKW